MRKEKEEEEEEREGEWRQNSDKIADRGKDRETAKQVYIIIDSKRENVVTWLKCLDCNQTSTLNDRIN